MKLKSIVAMLTSAAIIAAISVSAFAGTPFAGSPIAVGGGVTYIEAEDFDIGGENACWFPDPAADTYVYRDDGFVTMDMDGYSDGGAFATRNGGPNYFIAYLSNMENEDHNAPNILEYTVNVEKAGTYSIDAIAATAVGHEVEFTFLYDGKDLGVCATFPDSTGGWNVFETVSAGEAYLAAGTHVFTAVIASGMNVDAYVLTLVKEDTSAASGSDSSSGGKDVPQTGDSGALPFVVVTFMVSVVFIALILKRYGKVLS